VETGALFGHFKLRSGAVFQRKTQEMARPALPGRISSSSGVKDIKVRLAFRARPGSSGKFEGHHHSARVRMRARTSLQWHFCMSRTFGIDFGADPRCSWLLSKGPERPRKRGSRRSSDMRFTTAGRKSSGEPAKAQGDNQPKRDRFSDPLFLVLLLCWLDQRLGAAGFFFARNARVQKFGRFRWFQACAGPGFDHTRSAQGDHRKIRQKNQ